MRHTAALGNIRGLPGRLPSRFHFGLLLPFVIYSRCDECVTSRMEDSLRHSRSRINAYRALASPSLIALSSKDPILTAFELSWELRRLSFLEHEFKIEYQVKNWCSLLFANILFVNNIVFRPLNFYIWNIRWQSFQFYVMFYKMNIEWHDILNINLTFWNTKKDEY